MSSIVPLRSVGRGDLALAGGKGANLGELLRAGFPVPDGFVVTTTGYVEAVERAELAIDERVAAGDSAGLRAEIAALELPAALARDLRQAYARLGSGPVAVRSSATAEDLPGATFAGQQDTFLAVRGEQALVEAVRRCWASLWTERAVSYRQHQLVAPERVRIAVVVQAMVEADLAGVMFTADPVSGDRQTVIIDASPGLGEAVVSGLVTPDHYVVDARGRLREHTPGRREVVLRAAPTGGVVADPEAAATTLSERELAELARLGRDVAALFDRPQDIEWAVADGVPWLLQARPITALPPPPLNLGPAARRVGAILLELLPYRPYPIDVSTWLPYGPAGLMAKVIGQFGLTGAFDQLFTEGDGVVEAFVPHGPRPTPTALLAPWRIAVRARRYDPARWTSDPRFVDYLQACRDLDAVDLQRLDWSRLVAIPRAALDLMAPMTALRTDYLPRAAPVLVRLLLALTVLGRRDLMGDLVSGGGTRTEAANLALEALAVQVRADPGLADAVADRDPDRLVQFTAFQASFADFLAEFGHRETATLLLATSPTWGESPEVVLDLVRALAAGPPRSAEESAADAALRRLLAHPLLRDPRRAAALRRWVTAAQAAVMFREDSHFYLTAPLPALRRALLEIGRRLAEAGILTRADEIYHLRLEEVEPLGDPATLPPPVADRLRRDVQARAARREELKGVRMIDPAAIFPPQVLGDALVSGMPAGGGRATGPVAVINSPADFGRLRSGDVLVAPSTNPSWTPLFQLASAVVVDSGGVVSHAAIVAREYGIPAVMGAGNATAVLTAGQLVTVDGDTGRVTAAEPGRS